ncbi:MAG: helix-turn-helix domain-containing protein [Blautia sp.]|nr:helix-turn-helix domain-containing protein [Blautia sp.]
MYDKFEKLLKRNGVTPYRVHKETGISTATLSDWKNGKSQPKKDKIEKICEYFNVPLSYFYGEEETTLTARDERDIAKDLENIMHKLKNGEDGPASFEGTDIPEADQELFAGQLELMLRRLKAINKEKYNPNKNKK